MLIYSNIADLQAFLTAEQAKGHSIGFVPTMGALHQGHISLINQSQRQCQVTVCSIFVNPTQFNDKGDLERYPRTPEEDTKLLHESGCTALFMPAVNEMYPDSQKVTFNFDYLDKILEGEHRPGHFNGVAQVVKRFFEILQPNMAFFGSKDYQQVMVVKALVKQFEMPVEIVACPILREADGLAMSSRNVLLGSEERKVAGKIPQIMQKAKTILANNSVAAAKQFVNSEVEKEPLMKLDYYEVCDPSTLKIYSGDWKGPESVSLIAVFVGKVRLIDNLV